MITFNAIPKAMFLDRDVIIRGMDRATQRGLIHAGGSIKTIARRSMRYRKKASPPGAPPSAHRENGALLRKLLFFAYDRRRASLIVGPVSRGGARSIPALHEFGGVGRSNRDGAIRFPERSYMAPALRLSADKIPRAWKSAVRGTA